MSMQKRGLIKIAIALIGVGALIFCGIFAACGFSPAEFARTVSGYEQRSAYMNGSFSRVRIEDIEANIHVLPSADGCVVMYDQSAGSSYHVGISDDELTIKSKKNWRNLFGVIRMAPQLTVYLPEAAYEELYVHTISGSIRVENLNWGEVNLETTSGKIHLNDANVEGDATLKTVSGRIEMTTVRAGSLYARTTSGGIRLEDADAGDIELHTVSGSIKGELLSNKVFSTSTVSGRIDVPESAPGAGNCRASTTSGSIRIAIAN